MPYCQTLLHREQDNPLARQEKHQQFQNQPRLSRRKPMNVACKSASRKRDVPEEEDDDSAFSVSEPDRDQQPPKTPKKVSQHEDSPEIEFQPNRPSTSKPEKPRRPPRPATPAARRNPARRSRAKWSSSFLPFVFASVFFVAFLCSLKKRSTHRARFRPSYPCCTNQI